MSGIDCLMTDIMLVSARMDTSSCARMNIFDILYSHPCMSEVVTGFLCEDARRALSDDGLRCTLVPLCSSLHPCMGRGPPPGELPYYRIERN